MSALILCLLTVAFCAAVAMTVAWVLTRRENQLLRDRLGEVSAENVRLQQKVEHLEEMAADNDRNFRRLADEALRQNSDTLTRNSRQSLESVLQPMRQDIENFRRTVAESYDREARERFALDSRIRDLVKLNQTIGEQTDRLTTALQGGGKAQGVWGEMMLENILETSGLRRGIDFVTQEKFATDAPGHAIQPDVVINYTHSRRLIVDSKVSLTAYLRMTETTDPDILRDYARQHVASVAKHVSELSAKNYQDYVSATGADFVLMFIPHEGAFIAAMRQDPALWEKAYNARVLIISPAHLMSIVKIVGQLWQQQQQNDNALRIAREATAMADKFQAMLEDLGRLNTTLATAQRQWDAIHNRICGRGGIMSRMDKLNRLGIKSSKEIPPQFRNETTQEDTEDGDSDC